MVDFARLDLIQNDNDPLSFRKFKGYPLADRKFS